MEAIVHKFSKLYQTRALGLFVGTEVNTSSELQVDGQTEESWNDILQHFADASIYQSWAYGAVRWGERNLSHVVLRRNSEVLAAAQLRIARLPLIATGMAYLRSGPVCEPRGAGLDARILSRFIESLRHEYVYRRGLALQIIPNAFEGTERGRAFRDESRRCGLCPQPSLGRYQTVMVDLVPSPETLRSRLNQKWRNQLNCAERREAEVELSASREGYGEFVRLYQDMQERKGFESSVDVAEFGRIHEQLPAGGRLQIFLAKAGNETVGALVCSHIGDTGIYLLGATNQKGRELKAAYLLHWQAMMWLKERGACRYDLGGIDTKRNPGGHHFKKGLGGHEVAQVSPQVYSNSLFGSALLAAFAMLYRRRSLLRSTRPLAAN